MKRTFLLAVLLFQALFSANAQTREVRLSEFPVDRLEFLKLKTSDNRWGFISIDFKEHRASWWISPTQSGEFAEPEIDLAARTVTLVDLRHQPFEKYLVTLELQEDLSAVYSDATTETGVATYVLSSIQCGRVNCARVGFGFTELDAVRDLLRKQVNASNFKVSVDDLLHAKPSKNGYHVTFTGKGEKGHRFSGEFILRQKAQPLIRPDFETGLTEFLGYEVDWGSHSKECDKITLYNERGELIYDDTECAPSVDTSC